MTSALEKNYPLQCPRRHLVSHFLIDAGFPEIPEVRFVVIRTGSLRLSGKCGPKMMFARDFAPKSEDFSIPKFYEIHINRVPRQEEKPR